MKVLRVFISVTAGFLMCGCGTTMLVGGLMENEIVATIDMRTLTPSIQSEMQRAKTLGIVASERSEIKAADLMESRGGYLVKIARLTAKNGEMTGSERRAALANVCKTIQPDVAMLSRVVKTGSNSTFEGMFTGRSKVTQAWVTELMNCSTQVLESFGGSLQLNIGVFDTNQKQHYEEQVGAEIGGKILAALGRSNGAPIASANLANLPSGPQAVTTALEIPRSPIPQASLNSSAAGATPSAVQKRLIAKGYKPGVVDGTLNVKTVDAIKKFQRDNKLVDNGVPDEETWAKLSQKTLSTKSTKGASSVGQATTPAKSGEKATIKDL